MRVLVILKATKNSEAGAMPSQADIEAGIRFNEEMVKAGILKATDGLKPSKFGKRLSLRAHRKPSITDGPFAETKELIAGYWMIKVNSKEEAIEWAKRVPFRQLPSNGRDAEIELRQIFELEDFVDVPPAVAEMEKSFGTSPRRA